MYIYISSLCVQLGPACRNHKTVTCSDSKCIANVCNNTLLQAFNFVCCYIYIYFRNTYLLFISFRWIINPTRFPRLRFENYYPYNLSHFLVWEGRCLETWSLFKCMYDIIKISMNTHLLYKIKSFSSLFEGCLLLYTLILSCL